MIEPENERWSVDPPIPVREILINGLRWNMEARLLAIMVAKCNSGRTNTVTITEQDLEAVEGIMITPGAKRGSYNLTVRVK